MALPGGAGGRDAPLRSARCARSLYAAGSAPPARAVVAWVGTRLCAPPPLLLPRSGSSPPRLLLPRPGYFFPAPATSSPPRLLLPRPSLLPPALLHSRLRGAQKDEGVARLGGWGARGGCRGQPAVGVDQEQNV